MPSSYSWIFLFFLSSIISCNSFVTQTILIKNDKRSICNYDAYLSREKKSVSLPMASSSTVPTLTDATVWQIRLKTEDIPSKSGEKIGSRMFKLKAQFTEEEGYEPPQGFLKQMLESPDEKGDDVELKIANARWLLSEDPEDRQAGLWIWGLFKEPLYPFMLLTIETEELELENNLILPSMTFFAQIPHRRKDGAVSLENTVLNMRNTEKLQLIGSVANYFEDVPVGQLQINPLDSAL